MKSIVFGLVGPTASGKTGVSLALAQALGGQIVCMDSMQIYRGMDIGTAKPTAKERACAPHFMLDVAEPGEDFSVAKYAGMARPLLDTLSHPILTGGTGLYLSALSMPLDFGFVKGDETIRRKYEELCQREGKEALHALLEKYDPPTAARLHPNDVRRVVRALEVLEMTGKPFSAQEMPSPEDSPYDFRLYALDMPRDALYRRIEKRVDDMLSCGLPGEVQALLKAGVPPDCQAMQGLGYKELIPVLRGESTLESAAALIKQRTRNYAKRQLTWFRRDGRIKWLSVNGQSPASLAERIVAENQ